MEYNKIIDLIIFILSIVGFLLIVIGMIDNFYYFMIGLTIILISVAFMVYEMLGNRRDNNGKGIKKQKL